MNLFNSVYLDENYNPGRIVPQAARIVKVPRDIFSPDIKAVQIKTKGSYLNNYIAYYYYSKHADKSAHGKLSVVGQEWINDDIGIHETYYFLGIYEEKIGGGANILNPDPSAKNKYICKDMKDNVVFIAPVVSLVHSSTLRENHNKREALQYTDKVFEQQSMINDLDKKIQAFKVSVEKMTNTQKVQEVELIEQLVKAEQEKDSSIFRKLLHKKSA